MMIRAFAALLEVSDKDPTSILRLWTISAVLGISGFFVAQRVRWLAVGLVVFQLFGFWAALGELNAPFVGPAIKQESGSGHYLWHLCGAAILGALLPVIGAVHARSRKVSETRAG